VPSGQIFYPVVERTAQEFGLTIVPDSQPGAGHYYRSDHFSFARAGVPAFSIDEGDKYQGHDRNGACNKRKTTWPSITISPVTSTSGYGFRGDCRDGSLRNRAGMASRQSAGANWLAAGRRIRQSAAESEKE